MVQSVNLRRGRQLVKMAFSLSTALPDLLCIQPRQIFLKFIGLSWAWTNLEKPPKSQSWLPQLILHERGSFIEFWELFQFPAKHHFYMAHTLLERNRFSGKSFRGEKKRNIGSCLFPSFCWILRFKNVHRRAISHRLCWGKERSSNRPMCVQPWALTYYYSWTSHPSPCHGTYSPIDIGIAQMTGFAVHKPQTTV